MFFSQFLCFEKLSDGFSKCSDAKLSGNGCSLFITTFLSFSIHSVVRCWFITILVNGEKDFAWFFTVFSKPNCIRLFWSAIILSCLHIGKWFVHSSELLEKFNWTQISLYRLNYLVAQIQVNRSGLLVFRLFTKSLSLSKFPSLDIKLWSLPDREQLNNWSQHYILTGENIGTDIFSSDWKAESFRLNFITIPVWVLFACCVIFSGELEHHFIIVFKYLKASFEFSLFSICLKRSWNSAVVSGPCRCAGLLWGTVPTAISIRIASRI